MCGAVFHNFHKLTYIRPERVYKEALGLVRADPRVAAAMGSSLKGGQLRAYKPVVIPRRTVLGWAPCFARL